MSGFTPRNGGCCRRLLPVTPLVPGLKAIFSRSYTARQTSSPPAKNSLDAASRLPSSTTRRSGRPRSLTYHYLNDAKAAARCALALDPKFYSDVTVIEVNPGPGIFTRALFDRLKPKNYVIMDRHMLNKAKIDPIVKASNGVVKHFDLDGWDFNSYAELIKRKLISPQKQDPSEVNSSLLFVGNFSEANPKRADGFVSQLINFMYSKAFLYDFGRVKTLIWMQHPGWQHLLANSGHPDRKKVTIMRDIASDARLIARSQIPLTSTRRQFAGVVELELDNEKDVVKIEPSKFTPKASMALIEMTPRADLECKATLEEFEYFALKLNMVSLQPIKIALTIVAPGAEILLKAIEPYDPRLTPNKLTIEQWRKLGDAFHDWVFKPDVLEDEAFIDDDLVEDAMYTSVIPSREFSPEVQLALEQAEESQRK